jgi:hypothetical protein
MKNISIKMAFVFSLSGIIALIALITLYTSSTKAQTSTLPSLTGSCGFVLNTTTWGFVPEAGKDYDWGPGYGVINFDKNTLDAAVSLIAVKSVGVEPDFEEKIISHPIKIQRHPFIPSAFKLIPIEPDGTENSDYQTIISTNGGNTFLMAGRRGDATGVCQKI